MMRSPWATAVHLLEHTATVIVGVLLAILGLGLIFSIVFFLPGVIVLLVGIGLVVGGMFAHPARRRRGAGS